MKRQQKLETELSSDVKTSATLQKSTNMLTAIKHKIWSSQGNLNKTTKESSSMGTLSSAKFSDLVGAGSGGSSAGSIASRAGTVQRRVAASKFKSQSRNKDLTGEDSSFKIGEIEADGRRTVTSLNGLQRDSEVLYVGTFSSNEDNGKRGKICDVFEVDEASSDTEHDMRKSGYGTLSRSFSQPDFLADCHTDSKIADEVIMQRPSGLFDRPMLGSIAFRRSVTAALSQLHPETNSIDDSTNSASNTTRNSSSLAKSRSGVKPRQFLNISDSDSDGIDGFSDDDQEDAGSPIQRFLAVWGLEEYLAV